MPISARLMRVIDRCGEMTEEEIRQEIRLCEEDIETTMEDLAQAVRILRAIWDVDGKTIADIKVGR